MEEPIALETLDISIDELFNDPAEEKEEKEEKAGSNEDMTKAVSERINTVRRKTESETQSKIAKELGYESYEELQKANEKKLIRDAGIDEDDIAAVVDKLVEKRISNDPRMKKLEEIEQAEKNSFVKAQLDEINTIAGTKFTSVDQLPKETLDMWEKIGNLRQAFLATEGATLISKHRISKSNGSLQHLAVGGESPSTNGIRPLTDEEKAIYRSVMPDITEDELAKKTTTI